MDKSEEKEFDELFTVEMKLQSTREHLDTNTGDNIKMFEIDDIQLVPKVKAWINQYTEKKVAERTSSFLKYLDERESKYKEALNMELPKGATQADRDYMNSIDYEINGALEFIKDIRKYLKS